MAIWSTANTSVPLVTAVVPAGTAAPLVGTNFREVAVTPTLLLAGHTYVIGAFYDRSDTDLTVYDPDATVTYSSLITAGSYQTTMNVPGGLAYPGFVSEYRGLYGPNFAFKTVPEPSMSVLLGVGAIGLLGWAWRKRKLKGSIFLCVGLLAVGGETARCADRGTQFL